MADLTPAVAPRITLRQLPFAARLVLSVFLIAVGLGYFSAMVQLHMKHSKKEGEPLPTPADVVEVFAGLKLFDPTAPVPISRAETLLTGDPTATDMGKDNMAPAFFAKSKGWTKQQDARRADLPLLKAEHDGELKSMLAWVRSDAAKKKQAYDQDNFPRPDELKDQPITSNFLTADGGVKMKSLIEARCQNCHAERSPSLETYAELEPWISAPSQELIDGKWVRSSRQSTVEHLTQSTHAHLLTFAVLFTMTGLTFAFSTYWGVIRGVVGPMVLIAQVADISCWWLARVPHYGVYFAYAILGTGAVVGIGLTMQIILSLLNMYGIKGKIIVMLLLFGGASGLGLIGLKVIQPALDAQKLEAEKLKSAVTPPVEVAKLDVVAAAPSHLEKLIMGPRVTSKEFPYSGQGTMAPSFFEKDGATYKKQIKDKPALEGEREGERLALQAWLNTAPAAREKAFADDSFAWPQAVAGKPLTPDYLTETKTVKVKSILVDRCVRCHGAGGEQEEYSLETYEQLRKYIDAKPAGAKDTPKPKY